jgi:hypothetical protein
MHIIFLAAKYHLQFPCNVVLDTVSKCPFSFSVNLGNKAKLQRGMITMPLLVTNCGFQGTCGRVRCCDEGANYGWSFKSHIFSQESQNITVNVRVHRSVRRNKFMINHPLHTEKKKKQ